MKEDCVRLTNKKITFINLKGTCTSAKVANIDWDIGLTIHNVDEKEIYCINREEETQRMKGAFTNEAIDRDMLWVIESIKHGILDQSKDPSFIDNSYSTNGSGSVSCAFK